MWAPHGTSIYNMAPSPVNTVGSVVGGSVLATNGQWPTVGFLANAAASRHINTNRQDAITKAVTVAVWFIADAASTTAPTNHLAAHEQIRMTWNAGGAFQNSFHVSVGGTFYSAQFSAGAANTLYHHVGTYDGETVRAYQNGVESANNPTPSGDMNSPGAVDWKIAARFSAPDQEIDGIIYDFRVYDRALTAEQVHMLYDHKTRFDLAWQPGRVVYFIAPAAAAARNRQMALLGVGV
jgi:hypothetical protein